MKIITDPKKMQREALALRKKEKKIAFVPTMGALHEGHLTLLRKAKKLGDVVILSIYVNPTQFGPKEDFKKYPRPIKKDLELAKKEGTDIVFNPYDLYFSDDSTYVEETICSQGRCGNFRPGHFRGVATVVTKLFNIVLPDVAIFGQKDAQQCDVIERMVRDLFQPVKIIRMSTLRDSHQVAMSSRNQYLSEQEYAIACALPQALKLATEKKGLSAKQVEAKAKQIIQKNEGMELQYVEWANGALCVAVMVGKTRLIDNIPYTI
jgi:pantoate--beta-alanine ligase